LKSWRPVVENHVRTWSTRLADRSWWPRYVYHHTDVTNAVRILESGELLSRAEAERRRVLAVDAAPKGVIDQTSAAHLEYARLYFRPRTPTQYHCEGIRPVGRRWTDSKGHTAHCPVPVFFAFHTVPLLCRDDVEVSNGNMGKSGVQHDVTQSFFESIPFADVFHSGPIARVDLDRVIFHRNAEVLVPRSLPLGPELAFVACRSIGEQMTLLHLLRPDVRSKWQHSIGRLGYDAMFERKWLFVERIGVEDNIVVFRFNPNATTTGPFHARFEYREATSALLRVWDEKVFHVQHPLRLRLDGAERGEARLYLDDCLAFAGAVSFDEIPF
jgi:hypothetical protein